MLQNSTSMKILLVFAVEGEVIDMPQLSMVLTGIGKTNATYNLTKSIGEHRPDLVINIGTVGTQKLSVGDIVVSQHFIDRDYSKLKDYGVNSEIIFNEPIVKKIPSIISGKESHQKFIVNTGDEFVTEDIQIEGDVVDMESFALAFVCQQMNIPFFSIKYVTDVIGKNSIKEWEDKLSEARLALKDFLNKQISLVDENCVNLPINK